MMSDAGDEVYSELTIKREPIATECENQFSCSLIKVEKDSADDTEAVSANDRYEYYLELAMKREEPCVTPTEQQGTDIDPTVIQPQYIGSSLHTTDASKAELIQCGGADVALDTTTPGAASYLNYSTGSRPADHTKKKPRGILKGNLTRKRARFVQKTFSCDICQRNFKVRPYLVSHMRVHAKVKPFSCSICEYKTAVKSRFVRHVRIHSKEKPFSCNICEYKSADTSYLVKHMRIHTKE